MHPQTVNAYYDPERNEIVFPAAILQIKADPHSPDWFRGQLPEMNLDPFYAAFDVRPGDGMYRAPADRVSMW